MDSNEQKAALPTTVERFLSRHVLARELGVTVDTPRWHATPLGEREPVYLYHEQESDTRVVGKFYARKARESGRENPQAKGETWMLQEYEHLLHARLLGFDGPPARVVRPIAAAPALEALLVTDFVDGDSLDAVVEREVHGGSEQRVRDHLDRVAAFLAALHDRSRRAIPSSGAPPLSYLEKITGQLDESGIADGGEIERLATLRAAWQNSGALELAARSLVHGDATPANFMFTRGSELVIIDLERMHMADRALDLGCLIAELENWFLSRRHPESHATWAAKCIETAYREARDTALQDGSRFDERLAFYRGTYLLRIARNDWLDREHRRRMIERGLRCLER